MQSFWRISSIVLLLCTSGSAQTEDRATLLLREVTSEAQAMKSWRAEVVETRRIMGQGMNLRSEVHSKIAVQSPSRMLHENSGDDRTLSVCDGTDRYYSGGGNSFYRVAVSVAPGCNFLFTDLYQLEKNPVSAVVVGRDRVQLAEGPHECEVVRAEWNREGPGGALWHLVRTICIDTSRKIILSDRNEATDARSDLHSVATIRLESVEINPVFPPGTFEFPIATGAMQDHGPETGTAEPMPVNGVYPVGPHISYPGLISKVEPSYSDEARQSRLSGLILVSLEVTADGAPQAMKVVRSLGHGLDEKAIECVGKWHFHPAMRDGQPIAAGPVVVAVYFRLPGRISE